MSLGLKDVLGIASRSFTDPQNARILCLADVRDYLN
jgi:hypothetical protein